MEQIVALKSNLATKSTNDSIQNNNQDKIFSFSQILAELATENELIVDEQSIAYHSLNNILALANESQCDVQKLIQGNMQENNQYLLQNTFNLSNNNLLINSNKELQKLLMTMEENDIKFILENVAEIIEKKSIQTDDENSKDTNFMVKNKTINLQNNLLFNNLFSLEKVGFSDYTNQDFEVKTIDLNQLQITSNNIANETNVDSKLLNSNQGLQNLFVNDNFTNELGKIIIKNLKLPNGDSETKIQLQPKELGQVNVKLSTHNGQISAQIIAETAMGKEMLENQIHQLKNSLSLLGYQVEKIDVQQASSSSSQHASSSNQYNNGFGFSEQRHFQQQEPEQDRVNYSGSNLNEEEEVLNDIYYLSGIDYTV